LGLYYQISNDYHNLFRQEVTSALLVLDIWICPCVLASHSAGVGGVDVNPNML
jgi:hypothetical protein